MKRGGHYALSFVLCLPVVVFMRDGYGVALYLSIMGSTMIPNKETGTGFLKRRGFGHTIWFGVMYALVVASVVTALLVGLNNGVMSISDMIPDIVNGAYLWVVVAIGCFVGVLSHLLADGISEGSSNRPIKPMWPVFRTEIRLGLFSHDSVVVNHGLLRLMAVLHFLIVFTPIVFIS